MTTVTYQEIRERKLTAIDRTAVDVAAGHYRYTDTAGRTYVLEAGPPPLVLEHHPDCATSRVGDSVLTAGCVPDCHVRQLGEHPIVPGTAAVASPQSRGAALTDLADGAIAYAIGRLEAAFAELGPDALGLVRLGGFSVRAETALDALRRMLETPWAECDRVTMFAHGELEAQTAERFRAHLGSCSRCEAALNGALQSEAQLSDVMERPPAAVAAPADAMTTTLRLEEMYPITAPYLRTLRDVMAGPFERIDAAHWLLENGFGDSPLIDIDLRAAGRGELPGGPSPGQVIR